MSEPRTKVAAEADTDAALSNLFSKWLNVLYISKSRLVLECVAELYMKLKNKNVVFKLDEKIQIYFRRMNIDHQYKSIDLIFKLSVDDIYESQERYALAKTFLPCMLKHCSYDCFEMFYARNINELIRIAKENLEIDSNVLIVKKSIYFILFEILFSKINLMKLNDNTCLINKSISEFESVLKKDCMNALLKFQKENFKPDENTKKNYCICHCNALNAMISLISNTTTNITYYNKFLFNENIWENIISDDKIVFPNDFDQIPTMRKIFINIRKEKTENDAKYLKSQSILHSSLSEDVFKYDFTNISLRTQTENKSENYEKFELENIDINNHECMATFCGLIHHMIENNISPRDSDELPIWMKNIQKILLNENTKVNVKIFFARVIHNLSEVFQCYSKYFYVPVIKIIVDKCGGDTINYFVTDLIKMLIEWPDSSILENESELLKQLFLFLMNNVHSERKDVLKFNLDVLKTVFDLWKKYLGVKEMILPEELSLLLLEKLKGDVRYKNTGIQLVGIVLANNIMPWNKKNIEAYILQFDDMLDQNKIERKSLSEVIGMSLEILKENKWQNEFLSLEKRIKRSLQRKNLKGDPRTELKFVQCLEQVQIHYPDIINEFIKKINDEFLKNIKNNAIVLICLKNMLRYMQNTKIPLSFEEVDLKSLLNNPEEDVQILTLEIINKIIELSEHRKFKIIFNLLNDITKFKNSTNTNVRSAMYEIFVTIHKKYEDVDLIKKSRSVLLSGLVDTDSDLQEKIQKFWTDKELLPTKLCERYKKLLTDFYSSDTELYYLGYSVYFLLDGCKISTDYDKSLNEFQLKDCKYEKYNLNLQSKSSYSLTPLFFDSYASQFGDIAQQQGVRETNLRYAETQSNNIYSSTQNTSSFLFKTNQTLSTDLFDERYVRTEKKTKLRTVVQPSGRFLKNKEQIGKFFAKREVYKNIKRAEYRRDRIKNRDAAIAVFRDYRKGDFPDIQIKYSDIIKPLQALARVSI